MTANPDVGIPIGYVEGRIPLVATGNETKIELNVDVEADGIVALMIRDLSNDVWVGYQLNGTTDTSPRTFSSGPDWVTVRGVPLHRLERIEGDAEVRTDRSATDRQGSGRAIRDS